jgi:hypothetical protein
LEEESTRRLEYRVSLECRDPLVLGSQSVQNAGVERRALRDICTVQSGQLIDVGISGMW